MSIAGSILSGNHYVFKSNTKYIAAKLSIKPYLVCSGADAHDIALKCVTLSNHQIICKSYVLAIVCLSRLVIYAVWIALSGCELEIYRLVTTLHLNVCENKNLFFLITAVVVTVVIISGTAVVVTVVIISGTAVVIVVGTTIIIIGVTAIVIVVGATRVAATGVSTVVIIATAGVAANLCAALIILIVLDDIIIGSFGRIDQA